MVSNNLPNNSSIPCTNNTITDDKVKQYNPNCVDDSDWAIIDEKNKKKYFSFNYVCKCLEKLGSNMHTGLGSKKVTCIILGNLFRLIMHKSFKDILYAIQLCSQSIAPEYFGLDYGIGENMLIKSICSSYSLTENQIKTELKNSGDLGQIAFDNKLQIKPLFPLPGLHLKKVYEILMNISLAKGKQSQSTRKTLLQQLFISAKDLEAKYIVRMLEKQLRIGIQRPTIINALAMAVCLSPVKVVNIDNDTIKKHFNALLTKGITNDVVNYIENTFECLTSDNGNNLYSKYCNSGEDLELAINKLDEKLRLCYCHISNLVAIAFILFHGASIDTLFNYCSITYGIPINPMLAKAMKSYIEVDEAIGNHDFRVEFKYDGERVQIHKISESNVMLFSRNLENINHKYPDIIQYVTKQIPTSCILDAEIVAIDENGMIQNFQKLSTRKRKDVTNNNVTINVKVFVFDCLKYEDEIIYKLSLEERYKYIEKLNIPEDNMIVLQSSIAQNIDSAIVEDTVKNLEEIANININLLTNDSAPVKQQDVCFNNVVKAFGKNLANKESIEPFMILAISQRTEGLVIKLLNGPSSTYEPSKRNTNWMKLKKDYIDNLGDSLDLVVVGGFYGRGRRNGIYGSYLLAAYDDDDEIFRTTCKVATGFSDSDLSQLYILLTPLIIQYKPAYYSTECKPDVWFSPRVVFEVKAADLSVSPVHTACKNLCSFGVGLRFPRFLRIREDKTFEQSTNSLKIKELYDAQFSNNHNHV